MSLIDIILQGKHLPNFIKQPLPRLSILYEDIQPIVYISALDEHCFVLAYLADETPEHTITFICAITPKQRMLLMKAESLRNLNSIIRSGQNPIAVLESENIMECYYMIDVTELHEYLPTDCKD